MKGIHCVFKNRLFILVQWIILDAFLITMAYLIIAGLLRLMGFNIVIEDIFMVLPWIIVFKIALFYLFGIYRMMIRFYSIEDVFKVTTVSLLSNVLILIGLNLMYSITPNQQFIVIFVAFLEVVLINVLRISHRAYNSLLTSIEWHKKGHKRTLIIGAGAAAEMVLKELRKNPLLNQAPVLLLDDDANKIGQTLLGVQILGPLSRLETLLIEYDIEEVIVAIANIPYKTLKDIVDRVSQFHVRVRRLPLLSEMTPNQTMRIIDVDVEDLLNRDEIELDNLQVKEFIKNQVVLITGGGGSIGSELARQVASHHCKQLIIFDIYENNAYAIQIELLRQYPSLDLEVIVGSVYNSARVDSVFTMFSPDIVFHAAAYKHVPMLENNAIEAVRTNILGTNNVAKACQQYNVKHMVLVSSDKAVRPTNVMGATKRFAEMLIQQMSTQDQTTTYSAVRFGNVLNSNGSVIPLFKKQIEQGGPVTITHPDITRFFMTIKEAVSLILLSSTKARGGEIFVLDMGQAVKIKDLAEQMIRLSGLKPNLDIQMVYTGLRPGEKLYEELLVNDKDTDKTAINDKIFIESNGINTKEILIDDAWQAQFKHLDAMGNTEVKKALKKLILSFCCGDVRDIT